MILDLPILPRHAISNSYKIYKTMKTRGDSGLTSLSFQRRRDVVAGAAGVLGQQKLQRLCRSRTRWVEAKKMVGWWDVMVIEIIG